MAQNTRRPCRTCGAPVIGQGKSVYCEAACNPRSQRRGCITCQTPVFGQGVIFCSDGCRPRCVEPDCGRSAVAKERCGIHYQHHLRDLRGRIVHDCATCGEAIPPEVPSKTWCSENCKPRCIEDGCEQPQRTANRCEYHYRTRGPRLCRTCSIPVRDRRQYCSAGCFPQCTVEWCAARGRTVGYCDRHYMQLRTTGSVVVDFGCCGICGTGIPVIKPDGSLTKASTRLCDECRGTFRAGSRTSVKFLIKRDGLACSLCPDDIDLAYRWPDPRSVSIDHIAPLSLGGSNDLSNLAVSHLGCNCSKGNRIK